MNMHLSRGVYFTLPDRKVYLFSEYREQYLKNIFNFRIMCEDAIGDSNIMICVENCEGFLDFQKYAIAILLESPVFGLTFDIGHNHVCGGLDEPYIIENKEHLDHMHMHDALGKKDHLALGTGELDLNRYLTLASEQNCRVVLETKTIDGLLIFAGSSLFKIFRRHLFCYLLTKTPLVISRFGLVTRGFLCFSKMCL